MRVKAIEKMYYGGRDRLPGDVYDMDDREENECNVLCLLGKIEKVSTEPLKSEMVPTEPLKPEAIKKSRARDEELSEDKHRYRRRDMRAEK